MCAGRKKFVEEGRSKVNIEMFNPSGPQESVLLGR